MIDRSLIKLIITDMDGTLLNSEKSVSAHTRAIVDALREKGVCFSICTGRIQPMTVAYAETLKLQSPYITANGALIYDPVHRKTLWREIMTEESVLALADFCEKNDVDYGVLTMETSFFSHLGRTWKRFTDYNEMARSGGRPEMKLEISDPQLHCLRGIETVKFVIYDESMQIMPTVGAFASGIPDITHILSQRGIMDITRAGVSKGRGVAELAKLMGLSGENICVFGDYLNDISMFERAGTAVAMGNALPEVKKAADFVTRTNDEDGVAYAITDILGLL